ncbi:MAG: hypothetical protein ABSF45_20115 [Terriglobia bacterium]|jgi:hypothetical protein
MLNALLKVLEIVMAATRKTPDQKRGELAKDLRKVYMDIDDIVLRGKKLIALFGNQTVVANAAIEPLLQQQAALYSLSAHLREVEPMLKIHLPLKALTLHVACQFKGEAVLFILDWLLNSPAPQIGEELLLPSGYSKTTPVVRRLLLAPYLSPEELAVEESRSDPENPWEFFFEEPINRYEWSDEQLQHPTILVATSEDLRKAEDTLNSIAAVGEELRLFLVEKFKLEDLL